MIDFDSYVSSVSLVPDYETEAVEDAAWVVSFSPVNANDWLIGLEVLGDPLGILFALVETHEVLAILIEELDPVDVCSVADSQTDLSDFPRRVNFGSCLVNTVGVLAIIEVHRRFQPICEI